MLLLALPNVGLESPLQRILLRGSPLPPKSGGGLCTGVWCGPGGGPEDGAGRGANARVYGDPEPARNAPGAAREDTRQRWVHADRRADRGAVDGSTRHRRRLRRPGDDSTAAPVSASVPTPRAPCWLATNTDRFSPLSIDPASVELPQRCGVSPPEVRTGAYRTSEVAEPRSTLLHTCGRLCG